MAKKSKRNRAKHQASTRKIEKEKTVPIESSKLSAETKIPVSAVAQKTSSTQAFQYRYVVAELRNIGIIAGALIIILIILTFVLG